MGSCEDASSEEGSPQAYVLIRVQDRGVILENVKDAKLLGDSYAMIEQQVLCLAEVLVVTPPNALIGKLSQYQYE